MSDPIATDDESLLIKVLDTRENLQRTRIPDGPDRVLGNFIFMLEVSAPLADAYIPLSIASGKKPAGFLYQIEGTARGSISMTDISCRGDSITQVTVGTIVYCKIPAGMTATLRIRIEVRGQVGKLYRVVINQLNYKHDPRDARYVKSMQDIATSMLKFS